MIVIAGGFDQDQGGMGGFQEWNQVSMLARCVMSCSCSGFVNHPFDFLVQVVCRSVSKI